ncbi:hypothetical protein KOR42_43930 [Thalassoglobus neptunius]|uniref:DUF937 domain-containing protein n=2 Tax=Thalassoglobus neptunius TaxID=1938619 RepID=A0A5C5W078_9PLAN|nr:hypothetical protein KOR42_43930 [Thalassoglobus neptunius]
MNLIDIVKDQATAAITDKLGTMLGLDDNKTKVASQAAIPALLSTLSGFVLTRSGADQLATRLNQFDESDRERVAEMMASQPTEAARKGYDFLSALLGSGPLTSLVGTLVCYLGSDTDTVKKLLGYVAPIALGGILKQFQGEELTPHGLENLFENQKSNIATALPKGLSLPEIPGPASLEKGSRSPEKMRGNADASFVKTWAPLAAVVVLGLFAWNFFQNPEQADPVTVAEAKPSDPVQHEALKPIAPVEENRSVVEWSQYADGLDGVVVSLRSQLAGISDVEEAQNALPGLKKVSEQIDGLAKLKSALPESAMNKATEMAGTHSMPVNELVANLKSNPDLNAVLGPVLLEINDKMQRLKD